MEAAAAAEGALREVLLEVKAAGVGDNKNVLLELNIESTRHHEIQLVGNGEWCLSMGGRDCSLQMHEQKLLEISITQEELAREVAEAEEEGEDRLAAALRAELATLRKMEAEAERFGRAVRLDSASTFECIVEGEEHYFMEVNTRIQVEHRVSELCYALRFRNPEAEGPDAEEEAFEVTSLVELMVLLARHGERLPRPARVPREGAAIEARLNATNAALAPHAGGLIRFWSAPIEGEIRGRPRDPALGATTGIARDDCSHVSCTALRALSHEDGCHPPARDRPGPAGAACAASWVSRSVHASRRGLPPPEMGRFLQGGPADGRGSRDPVFQPDHHGFQGQCRAPVYPFSHAGGADHLHSERIHQGRGQR